MYFNDSGEQLRESDSEREYFVTAEVFISNAASATLRKHKKQSDESRPKDRPGWLGLGKGLAASGHWRPAICKLTKEANVHRCLLNIYVDESILFQTVYIHLLRQTDIHAADNSLFFRKDCIAIDSTENQRWVAGNTPEPVYLQITKPGLRNLWISLLRSYAVPEIYGRWLDRPSTSGEGMEGGSYRMWREVQLTVAQGRNLGTSKVYDPSQNPDDIENEVELKDIDVFCEIFLNNIVCARTTLKKGLGLPEWHESFTFSDLPPFESLEIMVLKEKKFTKPTILGKVTIDLITFRRGELLEGWYPAQSANASSQLQLGELRLKVKVNEEIILPRSSYMALQQEGSEHCSYRQTNVLIQTLNTRNFLLWMHDLETKLHIKTLPQHIMHLAIVQETIIQQIQEAAAWEVEKAITSHQTIFRGNTVFTKVMEKCIAWYGSAFLEASIGSVLRKLLGEKVAIEVDPVRSGKNAKDAGRHLELLIHWCKEFWEQIYSVKESCPKELRALLDTIRTLVEEHGRKVGLPPEMQQLRPRQSVSAFIFLRFIVPGILHPHLFGLCSGLPDPGIQRSLKLVAKVIQSMANLNTADQKEISMRGIRDFITGNMPRMQEYLQEVSTPKPPMYSKHRFEDRDDRYVSNHLAQHKATLPILERESVPAYPHYIDPARELAIITSAVVRQSRDADNRAAARDLDGIELKNLCAVCFEVESEASQRVNELATRLAQERRRASAVAVWTKDPYSMITSQSPPSMPMPIVRHEASLPSIREVSAKPPEMEAQSLSKPHADSAGPSSNAYTGDYSRGGNVEAKSGDSPESLIPEAPDDGTRRVKGFMRGIFGSEPRNSSKGRH